MSKSQSNEEQWVAAQRKLVEEYLFREKVDHCGVGEWPAFHVHPHVALWAVQSKRTPGAIGWWAISGDLPTDYISSNDGRHPREALRAISQHWREVSDFMLRGEDHPDVRIGTPDQWPKLGDLLRRRAQILQEYADDDGMWQRIERTRSDD
jgi:hypothetical protein